MKFEKAYTDGIKKLWLVTEPDISWNFMVGRYLGKDNEWMISRIDYVGDNCYKIFVVNNLGEERLWRFLRNVSAIEGYDDPVASFRENIEKQEAESAKTKRSTN